MNTARKLDDYRLLGNSGLRVSPLCLGTMTFGTDWGWGADETASRAMFDRYAELGGNFIDTANLYTAGTSERFVGEFIKSDRDRFVVATKFSLNHHTNPLGGSAPAGTRPDPNAGGNGRKNLRRAIERSLRQLQTDYIDLYWIHAWDFSAPVDEVMRGLDDLVRQGKVLHLAVSDTPAWKVAQLNQYAADHGLTRFISYQAEYSLAQRDAERDILPMCRELGLGLLPWSPLAGGVLAGKYTRAALGEKSSNNFGWSAPADVGGRGAQLTERKLDIADAVKRVADEVGRSSSQVALAWLLSRAGVASVILGARTLAQLDDNLGCLDLRLSDAQMRTLGEASAIDLGFPHAFLRTSLPPMLSGGASVDVPTPYLD